MKLWKVLLATSIFLGASALWVQTAPANGSKGKRVVYEARIRLGESERDECVFLVELEPILFRITAVQNKYRAIRINLLNRGQQPLRLSLEKDSIQVRAGDKIVDGILNLAARESSFWNQLDPDLRKALAYPDSEAIRGGEEENVFVYVPNSDLPAFPDEFLFRIDSVSQTPIPIRPRRVAAASD